MAKKKWKPKRDARGQFAPTGKAPAVKKKSKRALGPKALAQQTARKTDRKRPGVPPGEDERIALRREKAMSARVQGGTIRQIADENECSIGTACEDIAAELAASVSRCHHSADEHRHLELERCDLVIRGFKTGVINGDAPSGRIFLAAVITRAKLLGLIKSTHVRPGEDVEEAELSEREVADRVAALVEFSRTPKRGDVVH